MVLLPIWQGFPPVLSVQFTEDSEYESDCMGGWGLFFWETPIVEWISFFGFDLDHGLVVNDLRRSWCLFYLAQRSAASKRISLFKGLELYWTEMAVLR